MGWKKLLESISESLNDHLRLRNDYLMAENRILRNQIDGQVQLTDAERQELAELGAKLGKKALADIATVAQPDTILAWNRQFAKPQVDISKPPRSVGRPRVDKEVENLVIRMARENRSWGYDRIQGALNHLGYTISDQTVGNILKRNDIPPAPERITSVTWREFVRIHLDIFGATDFFTSEVWSWFGFAISCLIRLMRNGFCQIRCLGMTLHRSTLQLRFLMRYFLAGRAHRQRWAYRIHSREIFTRSRMMQFNQVVPGDMIGFRPDQEQKARSPDLNQVVLLWAAQPRQRRDSPTQHQPDLKRLHIDSSHKAA